MAKRITQLSELSTAAQDDYIVIVDTSTGTTKKITVKNLTGLPDVGWTATGESWSYNAWNSTLKRGTITVPSDATTKYQAGMFVRFSQATGGTKWGRIISVTSTTLVVFMDTSTLTNEAISTPVYSVLNQPFGLPAGISSHNPYKFSAYRSSTQATGTGGFVKVQLNATDYDSNGDFDTATNYRFTAPVAGFYTFHAATSYAGSASTHHITTIYKNGSEIRRGMEGAYADAANQNLLAGTQLQLAAGDTIELYGYSTINYNFIATTQQTYMSGKLDSRT